jgi:hypothetical protein
MQGALRRTQTYPEDSEMKQNFKTKEEAPEELREFLKETEVEGVKAFSVSLVAKDRLDQMRESNLALSREKEGVTPVLGKFQKLLQKDKTVDDLITEVSELREVAQQVKDGKIKGSKEIEAEVTARTEAMKRANEETSQALLRENAALKQKVDISEAKYRQTIVDNAVMAAAADPKIGINPKAMSHVINAARGVFEVDEKGSLTPKDGGGNTMFGEDGVKPMTIGEWFKKLRTTDEFFFLGSSGGGAGGGGGSEKKLGGMTAAELAKLSPTERIRLANRAN